MTLLTLLLLIPLATAATPAKDDDKTLETSSSKYHLHMMHLVYTAEHDIVDIFFPLNALNFFNGTFLDDTEDGSKSVLFFAQADIKNGVKYYKGIYVLKNGNATKLLKNGKDVTATNDNTKLVYFGATDGLYSYDVENNEAIKYGTVTDNIIGLAKVTDSDVIYILTVTEEGTKKEKVDDVQNAEQIVLDNSNNLYYYSNDKKLYVKGVEGVKKIDGLPENPTEVTLLRPPLVFKHGVPCVVDRKSYMICSKGTSKLANFGFQDKPSAYSIEAASLQHFAYDKKIY